MSHKKFGPDRFSRFDVYWIQTNKQTNRQTDKPNLYIEELFIRGVLREGGGVEALPRPPSSVNSMVIMLFF